MAGADWGINVQLTGPLFKVTAPAEIIKATNTGLLDLALLEGVKTVRDDLQPKHGRVTGTLERAVGASMVADLVAQFDAGKSQKGANLVYASWVEGISTRNFPTTSFEGFGMFKKAKKHIETTAGIFEKYVGDAIARAFK